MDNIEKQNKMDEGTKVENVSEAQAPQVDIADSLLSLLYDVVPSSEASSKTPQAFVIVGSVLREDVKTDLNVNRLRYRNSFDQELKNTKIRSDHTMQKIIERIPLEERKLMYEIERDVGIPKEVLIGIRMLETYSENPERCSETGAFGRAQFIARTAYNSGARVVVHKDDAVKSPTIDSSSNIVKSGKTYVPIDDRMGMHYWGLKLNHFYDLRKSGGTWQKMFEEYNKDEKKMKNSNKLKKEDYGEKAMSWAKLAKGLDWDTIKKSKSIAIEKEELTQEKTLLDVANDIGFPNLYKYDRTKGAQNGHLGLFRVPLKALSSDIRIPIAYKPILTQLFTGEVKFEYTGDGRKIELGGFTRQLKDRGDRVRMYKYQDGHVTIPRALFKTSSLGNRQVRVGERIGDPINPPEFITVNRGKNETPTIDDIVRCGIPLEVIINANQKLFGIVNGKFDITQADKAIGDYMNGTYLEAGTTIYWRGGRSEEYIPETTEVEILDDKVLYEVFTKALETDKEGIQKLVDKYLNKYKELKVNSNDNEIYRLLLEIQEQKYFDFGERDMISDSLDNDKRNRLIRLMLDKMQTIVATITAEEIDNKSSIETRDKYARNVFMLCTFYKYIKKVSNFNIIGELDLREAFYDIERTIKKFEIKYSMDDTNYDLVSKILEVREGHLIGEICGNITEDEETGIIYEIIQNKNFVNTDPKKVHSSMLKRRPVYIKYEAVEQQYRGHKIDLVGEDKIRYEFGLFIDAEGTRYAYLIDKAQSSEHRDDYESIWMQIDESFDLLTYVDNALEKIKTDGNVDKIMALLKQYPNIIVLEHDETNTSTKKFYIIYNNSEEKIASFEISNNTSAEDIQKLNERFAELNYLHSPEVIKLKRMLDETVLHQFPFQYQIISNSSHPHIIQVSLNKEQFPAYDGYYIAVADVNGSYAFDKSRNKEFTSYEEDPESYQPSPDISGMLKKLFAQCLEDKLNLNEIGMELLKDDMYSSDVEYHYAIHVNGVATGKYITIRLRDLHITIASDYEGMVEYDAIDYGYNVDALARRIFTNL